MKRLLFALAAFAGSCAGRPVFAADPPRPALVVDAYTGSYALVTRGESREFLTARATATAPLFGDLSAFGRLDVGGEQDAGGLDYSDPSTFRRVEVAGGLGYDVGALRLVGLGGVTYSVEGTSDAPRDPRMYTMAALARVGIGESGYAYAGGGFHGPVGGWALLGALSIPAGPAFATVDYAFPLSQTALRERAYTLRVGAQVRVKRLVLGGR